MVARKSLASVRLLAPRLAIRARTVTPGTDLPGRTHSGTSATVVGVDQVRLAHAAADDLVRQVTHAVSTLAVLVRAAGFAAGAAVGVFRKGLACLCQGTVGLASGACTLESGACVLASLVAGAHGAARTTVVLQGQIGTCPRAGVGLPADLEGTRTLAAARLINPEYTCLARSRAHVAAIATVRDRGDVGTRGSGTAKLLASGTFAGSVDALLTIGTLDVTRSTGSGLRAEIDAFVATQGLAGVCAHTIPRETRLVCTARVATGSTVRGRVERSTGDIEHCDGRGGCDDGSLF